jgi:NAD(P)-dependent dehydrogenase (short-subunit alcohol dehydrogenase family)
MRFAVVTGGTRGIGRAIGERLVADGFSVLAAARTAAALPPGVSYVPLDVTDSAAVRAFFAGLERLDVLVNNAGLAGADAPWDAVIATNLTGTFHCCTAALPRLPDQIGRIVNIASTLGLRGVSDQPAYCAAKHGVIGLTRSLALAAAPRGVTVNAVCPGWVQTEMATQRFSELGITAADAAAGVPTGRLTTPAEVANVVAFLVREGSANITGHAMVIDGGGLAAA